MENKKTAAMTGFVTSKFHIPLLFFSFIIEVAVFLAACSTDCTSCINNTCVKCELGKYLHVESVSCHLCPEHCISCYISEACNNCTDGYFGQTCAHNCSLLCISNTCNKDSGVCTVGCINGYFMSDSSCFQCLPGCKTCANFSNNCLQCKDGNYGPSCDNSCSRCKYGICTRERCTHGCDDGLFQANDACNLCDIPCTSCSGTFNNCHTCKDGYYGPDCKSFCSGCIPCNQVDGSCPGTTMNPPTTSTDPTTPLIDSVTSVIRTMTQLSTSVSPKTNTSLAPSQISTRMESTHNQKDQSLDSIIIIYAAAGGGGGLAFLVLIVVVVIICKRRGSARSHEAIPENIEMTENENYISANDIDNNFPKSTDTPNETPSTRYQTKQVA